MGMAYDWKGRNVYWTDSIYGQIAMASLYHLAEENEENRKIYKKVVHSSNIGTPWGIEIHRRKR